MSITMTAELVRDARDDALEEAALVADDFQRRSASRFEETRFGALAFRIRELKSKTIVGSEEK